MCDAEQELAGRARPVALPQCPGRRQADGLGQLGVRDAGRRADVEAHRDVRAEIRLDARRVLRRQPRLVSVVDRAEDHAVVVELADRVPEREDLKAARIG